MGHLKSFTPIKSIFEAQVGARGVKAVMRKAVSVFAVKEWLWVNDISHVEFYIVEPT